MKRLLAIAVVMVGTVACDPCAGTPSCHTTPEISYSGQFIHYPDGSGIGGVEMIFVRDSGAELASDTIRTRSDASGFFTLRGSALEEGTVYGSITVTPPEPWPSYTVGRVALSTHVARGDGGTLGRWMVNPYLVYIGELHDVSTSAPLAGARIRLTEVGTPRTTQPALTFESAVNGRFMWTPPITNYGPIEVQLDVTPKGSTRTYHLFTTIQPQYRDEPPVLQPLLVGPGKYVGSVYRRGTKEFLPGVTVDFARTGGIHGDPDSFSAEVDEFGQFPVPIDFPRPGTMVGTLTVHVPGMPDERITGLRIDAFDGGGVRLFGPFGYGPAIIPRPVFLYRATGEPIKEGTWVQFVRTGGLAIHPAAWAQPDSGIRIVDGNGSVAYDAATDDSGTVIMDLRVLLNYPHAWDTVHAVAFPARYSDVPVVDTFRVGSWYPWQGEVHAGDTDLPLSGVVVQFRRTGGASVHPETFITQSRVDGTFPLSLMAPLDTGWVDGSLTVQGGGVYRDTTFAVRLTPAQDDGIRSIGIIRLTRSP